MKLTIFTPTYNRAYILSNLYRSLQRQTCRSFEWLIIDDGSTDGTDSLVAGWIAEGNDFPIRYYKVPNGGKCRAINRALDLAEGELFFTVDSDDYLTDDAAEKVTAWFEALDPKGDVQGIVANRGYSALETENCLFGEPYLDKPLLEIYTFYKDGKQVFDGERAFVFFTDFHKKYRYPEYEGENFMGEAVAWNRMAHDGYKMRFFNDIIWIFEYLPDGLTRSGGSVFLKNPRGYGLLLREKAQFLNWPLKEKVKMWYTFTCDLSEIYSGRQIAEFIGAPYLLTAAILGARKIRHALRKGKTGTAER